MSKMYKDKLKLHKLQIDAGNIARKVWEAMPEPKLPYTEWYYGEREQSLSEALEGVKGE